MERQRSILVKRLSTPTANNSNMLRSSSTLDNARSSKSQSKESATIARPLGSALFRPEPLLHAFKAYATRALRHAGLIDQHTKPWSRHGSTIYLWTEEDVASAIDYVLSAQ